eukprot:scaffold50044_cov50-Cyclotella_meneghiniana.AAC.1
MAGINKLKWSRVSQDVRGCFFQASAIVKLLNIGNQNYLVMAFVTCHREAIQTIVSETDNDVNAITEITKRYQSWLLGLKDDTDHHVRLIANFVIMSNDFIDFMDSIRKQDTIGIEDGYQTFACIWKLLGQSKYLNCFFEQLEMLHLDFDFSRQMEGRLNRTVRTFDANKNPEKGGVGHDEYLENCNKDLQGFPNVRTMVGRIRQGNLVGMARRCKRFVDYYYSPGVSRKVHKHGSGIKGNHHLEKDLIFEFTAKFLGNMSLSISRKLFPNSVAKIKCTTDLKRDKLVREMSAEEDSETNRLFNSVRHVQQSVRGELVDEEEDVSEYEREQARIMEEEYEVGREQSGSQVDDEVFENDDCDESGPDSELIGYCVEDMWVKGAAALEKMNPAATRQKQRDRLKRKKSVQKVILEQVQLLKEDAGNVVIDCEAPEELGSMHSNYLRSLNPRSYYSSARSVFFMQIYTYPDTIQQKHRCGAVVPGQIPIKRGCLASAVLICPYSTGRNVLTDHDKLVDAFYAIPHNKWGNFRMIPQYYQ